MYKKISNLVSIRRRFDTKEPQNDYNSSGKADCKVYNSVLELVGNTPLVKLNKLPKDHGLQCEVYAKCEFMNPAGSIKDRISLAMIQDARKRGLVDDNTEFVEATSGNTGIGIAFNAALMGNKCIIVTQDKNSSEKVNTMRLLGAEVIQTKNGELEISIARQLKNENPDTMVMLNQFDNDVNPRTHFENTGAEIVSALGDVDVVVLGAGTGGTMTGVGKKLKHENPKCIVVAAEPDGSTMINKNGKPHSFLVEGIGGTWAPIVLDKSVVDHVEVVTDQEAFLMSRELSRKEGLLCGGSSGSAMCAAIKAVKALNIGAGKRVVVILPDGIRNYMSKFVSDQWMEAHRFMEPPPHTMNWWKHPITELVLDRTYPKLNKDCTCQQALEAMKSNNVNIAVIVDNIGHFVGAVSKDSLRNRATNPTKLPGEDCVEYDFEDVVTDHLDKHVYKLADNAEKGKPTIGLLSRILDIAPYVIIGKEGYDISAFFVPSGVVTGDDVLDYIHEHSQPCNGKGQAENKVYNSILELVGNTPLVKLNKVPKAHGVECEIYAKCEFLNPSGSIKDRIALAMIQDARRNGTVDDHTEYVEATSGNTGIGIALNAALTENKCIIVTEEKNSSEKVNTVNLLGAEVIQTKNNALEISIARQLKDENPDTVVMLDQFDNPVNPRTHYDNTAEEILAALDDVDVVVMGTGTGGTMTGVAKKLKEKNPKCIVAVTEPDGSIMYNTNGKPHSFLVEGIGGSFIPIVCDKSLVDHFEIVTDEEAFLMSRELAKKEGLLCGGSSGSAMAAAIKAVKTLNIGAGKRVVVILPDGIRNYMSKFVSDQWMEAHRFMEPPEHSMKWWKKPITEIDLSRSYPKLNKDSKCEEALQAMKTNNVNIAVIVDDVGHFVGALSKDNLRNRATNPTKLPGKDSENFDFQDTVFNNLDKHVYTLAENGKAGKPTVGLLSRMLDITPYVIIGKEEYAIKRGDIDFFIPCGLVTGDDVLDYIHEHNKA